MPNFNFLACFKADIYIAHAPKLKHIHFTKSPKHDNIYKLCLWMLEEHSRLILTSLDVPTLRYRAHAQKLKPLLNCTESLKYEDNEILSS